MFKLQRYLSQRLAAILAFTGIAAILALSLLPSSPKRLLKGDLVRIGATSETGIVAGRSCTLAVYPYNTKAATDSRAADVPEAINYLDRDCEEHVTHGLPYSPQPPLETELPFNNRSARDYRIPESAQGHAYVNASHHASGTGRFYYKAYVKKFEVTLHADAYENINRALLSCDTPAPAEFTGDASDIFDCSGYAEGLYGDTRVTKTTSPSTKTITIVWEFGVNNPLDLPEIYGNNGPAFSTYDADGNITATLDLSHPSLRTLPFRANLVTRPNSGTVWSATSSSRVLVGNFAMNKDNYPHNFTAGCETGNANDSRSGWCFLVPDAPTPVEMVEMDQARIFGWYNIGRVATTWRKPPLPVLTLVKEVINNNGGTLEPENFELFVGDRRVIHRTRNTFPAGTYMVRETNRTGYKAGFWKGNCTSAGKITLAYGDDKICMVTNDDIAPEAPKLKIPGLFPNKKR